MVVGGVKEGQHVKLCIDICMCTFPLLCANIAFQQSLWVHTGITQKAKEPAPNSV